MPLGHPVKRKTVRPHTAEYSDLPDNRVSALAAAPDGAIWVHTWSGLARLHQGEWQTLTPESSGLPRGGVYNLVVAADGALWVNNDENLARFADGAWRVFTEQSLPGTGINDIRIIGATSDGSVWFDYATHGYLGGDRYLIRFRDEIPALRISHLESATPIRSREHVFAARGADPSYRTPSHLLRYRWRVLRGGELVQSTETLEPFLKVAFPEDGAYRIEVRAADREGSVSAPAVDEVEVALPD